MDTATRLKVLTTLTEAVREFWYEDGRDEKSHAWCALGHLVVERHAAFINHTNTLAIAAMQEARTRLFADLSDAEFAQAIAHIEGSHAP